MEIFKQLKALNDKVNQLKSQIKTEESSKHAFILPFINILGYDAFNPTEVVPEFTADLGLKKGEKVDYAIFQNQEPIMIIECKHWEEDLNVHNSQLFRYFHTTKTRFALLTNGITYRFFTDLEESNKMDKKPFFEFRIDDLKESTVKEVEKFHKNNFDVSKIVNNASSLKYTREIRNVISEEIDNPSKDLVKLFAKKAYTGKLTSKVVEEFTEIVKKAFSQTISEKVNYRLNYAFNKEQELQREEDELDDDEVDDKGIETTQEEMDGYRIILAILRRKVDLERIAHRDTKSYFGVLLDDNNRKPICRLHFNGSKNYIGVFDENKKEKRHQLDSLDDIYEFEEQLLKVVDFYKN